MRCSSTAPPGVEGLYLSAVRGLSAVWGRKKGLPVEVTGGMSAHRKEEQARKLSDLRIRPSKTSSGPGNLRTSSGTVPSSSTGAGTASRTKEARCALVSY